MATKKTTKSTKPKSTTKSSGKKTTSSSKNTSANGEWKTINGTHVFIENGKITKGPKNLVTKAKNDEDLWLNHMTVNDRHKVVESLKNENVKHAVIDNRMHGEKMESVLGKVHKALQSGKSINQLPKNVKNLKKGEYFTKKEISNPKDSQVWVRGEWIPSAKAYSCHKFSDVNQESLLKANTEIWTDFYF